MVACWRLTAIIDVAAVRLSYLLIVLLQELRRCNAHLLLHRETLPGGALIVWCIGVEVLQHERRLLQFLQFVLVVRLRGQPFKADVVVVVLPFGHVRHLQVLLRDRERIVSGANGEVQITLGAADAGEHHGRGLEVNGMQHSLLPL